jgi:hypothetical protein
LIKITRVQFGKFWRNEPNLTKDIIDGGSESLCAMLSASRDMAAFTAVD